MKRILIAIIFLLLTHISLSQVLNFQAALDSGKVEFKKQYSIEEPDYSKAYQLLKQAVNLKPDNAEARYFLGYTIDKLNAGDGSGMNLSKKELTIEASEQFEMVNRIAPQYKGELWVLDPYSKISSIWGSLAIAYLTKKDIDSSKWAFRNGKKRGGFLEPVLEFNRQLLNSCAKNAILISSGDNLTIPMWYLQQMENLRTDITIVDASLINTPWYVKYLKNQRNLKISYSDSEIDTINYLPWTNTNITIKNPHKSSKGNSIDFNWTLKPTYYDQYILKGDRILLDILNQNLFERTFYFTQGSDSTYNLFLDEHLVDDGIVSRVVIPRNDLTTPTTIISTNLKAYTIDNLKVEEIKKSKDAIFVLNGFRWTYFTNIIFLYSKKQIAKARDLLTEMEKKFHIEKLPYSSEQLQQNVEHLKQLLK